MFDIFTDTSSNLDSSLLKELNIKLIPFIYYVDGKEQTCLDTSAFCGKEFYDAMRKNSTVTTSQVTPQAYIDKFTPSLIEGRDILFVGMSSGISGSFSSAEIAAKELRETFPERRIRLVDTLSASLAEGMLALLAADLRTNGKSLDVCADHLLLKRMEMCQVFCVDDIKYLRGTGRISNFTAVLGSMLRIKPLLKGNEKGQIVCFSKTRSKKHVLRLMAEQYDKYVRSAGENTVCIAHADCSEDVDYLIGLLKINNPPKNIMVECYEPVTGSHVGPGTVALFFFGSKDFRAI